MNLVEAYECGKRVRHPEAPGRTASRVAGSLRWLDKEGCADTYVTVDIGTLHGWELVPEPPKRYDFVEALAMMRQGKWMRPVWGAYADYRRNTDGQWVGKFIDTHNESTVTIHASRFDELWEEAPNQ